MAANNRRTMNAQSTFTSPVVYFIHCLNCNVIFLWCTATNETVRCVFRHWKLFTISTTVICLVFLKNELHLFRLLHAQAHAMHHLPTIVYLDVTRLNNTVSKKKSKTYFKPQRCRNIIVVALSCNCTEN